MTCTPRILASCAMPPDRLVRMDSFHARSLATSIVGCAKGNAAMLGFASGANGVGGVQQRLGGNAAAVQADAAETFVAFDQDDFLAQVGRVKCRGVSAGAGANDHDFSLNWFHDN